MPKFINNDQRLDVRLPNELVRAARKKAKQQKRSLSDVLRELLRAWLASNKLR